jgi:alpha/beta superfamily hydrolase
MIITHRVIVRSCIGFCSALFLSAIAHAQTTDPYAALREGYARGDAGAAAQAYAVDGVYQEVYPGTPIVERSGRSAIAKGFADLFAAWGPPTASRPIDLNFRFTQRGGEGRTRRDAGVYRLRIGRPGAADAITSYGRFETEIVGGVFRRDRSGPASREDFEEAPGPVAFAQDDEALDPAFYDRFLGVYRDQAGCEVIVTRSVRRLFAFDACTRAWRGLNRLTGSRWSAPGAAVIGAANAVDHRFLDDAARLQIGERRVLSRRDDTERERVRFGSGELTLAGTILRPARAHRQAPGVVIVHGSGPQDRHGYASIMELLAVQFARAGVVALVFDKRGVGESQGDWASAGFSQLAADARAAQAFLMTRPGVNPRKIGFAGSSQAGWVAAKAIDDGARPAFVMLLGAAGAGSTVREQNLYSTRVRMQCAGIGTADIALALEQQRAFFDARRDPAREPDLAALTARAAARPGLADWLFPVTARRTGPPEWYDVLDPEFDPSPVWRRYAGPTLFMFSQFDDSTETSLVTGRLRGRPGRTVHVLAGAQHLGLAATDICAGDLDKVSVFHPDLWPMLHRWAVARAG